MSPSDLTAASRAERARRLAHAVPSLRLTSDGLMLGPLVMLAKRVPGRFGRLIVVAQNDSTAPQSPLRILHPQSTYQTDPKAE